MKLNKIALNNRIDMLKNKSYMDRTLLINGINIQTNTTITLYLEDFPEKINDLIMLLDMFDKDLSKITFGDIVIELYQLKEKCEIDNLIIATKIMLLPLEKINIKEMTDNGANKNIIE